MSEPRNGNTALTRTKERPGWQGPRATCFRRWPRVTSAPSSGPRVPCGRPSPRAGTESRPRLGVNATLRRIGYPRGRLIGNGRDGERGPPAASGCRGLFRFLGAARAGGADVRERVSFAIRRGEHSCSPSLVRNNSPILTPRRRPVSRQTLPAGGIPHECGTWLVGHECPAVPVRSSLPDSATESSPAGEVDSTTLLLHREKASRQGCFMDGGPRRATTGPGDRIISALPHDPAARETPARGAIVAHRAFCAIPGAYAFTGRGWQPYRRGSG